MTVVALATWLEDASGWIVALAGIITIIGVWPKTIWPRTGENIRTVWRRYMQWREDRRDLKQLIAKSDRLLRAVGENGGKSLHQRMDHVEVSLHEQGRRIEQLEHHHRE